MLQFLSVFAPRSAKLASRLRGAIFVAVALAVLCGALTAEPAKAGDWPTFRHDNYRSGHTEENLDAAKLAVDWTWQSPHPPQPAWHGPAKWDAYNDIPRINSMRNYDQTFHVAVAGKSLYFGSSVDDTVYCLDTASGEPRWRHTTDAPIRMAPTLADGHVYIGSDDGFAYCLGAQNGKVRWKFRAPADERLVINNGRLISFAPIRTGVTVADGTAYFGASLLPWKQSFLCAVDAKTGEAEGEGRFVKEFTESNSFEGPMLVSDSMLILSQGRIAPLLASRKTGEKQGRVDYHGTGCFVLLTPENQLYHGPGNRDGNFTASDAKTGARLATFPMGREMIVAGAAAFLLSTPTKNAIEREKKRDLILATGPDKKPLMTTELNREQLGRATITAFDRGTKKVLWRSPGDTYLTMIAAGDVIFAGKVGGVEAFSAVDGTPLWSAAVKGGVHGLAVADGALFASTDEGEILCFRPASSAASADEASTEAAAAPARVELPPPTAPQSSLDWGPITQFDSPTSAVVTWGTSEPEPTELTYQLVGREGAEERSLGNAEPKKIHVARLTKLERLENYRYTITGDGQENTYHLEMFFNYAVPEVSGSDAYPDDESQRRYAHFANQVALVHPDAHGICVMIGCGEGELAYELARRSKLRVLCVEWDAEKVARARAKLQAAGVYGVRVSVMQVDSYDALPLPSHFANLVLSQHVFDGGKLDCSAEEMTRIARPIDGTVWMAQTRNGPSTISLDEAKAWIADVPQKKMAATTPSGLWTHIFKNTLVGAGEWSHQYGRADNSSYGSEMLSYVQAANELEVQWIGRPGPRYQPDRQGRKTGPLAVNGRLFTQGLQRLIALDAYNGAILWSAEIPDMARMNVPRDSSNWCADNQSLFLALKGYCVKFDAQTGAFAEPFAVVPGQRDDWQYDWGYLASVGDNLIGSAVKQGSAYTDYWGHDAWYDQPKGPESFKVCSDNLFAVAKKDGGEQWRYEGGVIINSTITVGDGRVYFVECRNEKVTASDERRLGVPELWQDQYLVALDVATGEKHYEEPLDTHDGESVFYLAHRGKKLVIVASGAGEYEITAYHAEDGSPAWSDRFNWPGGAHDHGKAMSRPAFLRDWLVVRPRVYHLDSGTILPKTMPGGGCGTYACSWSHVFFRAANVVMWDARYEIPSSWSRLRPSCWLSTIPACGMLLSPEAGGGCSCGKWMETSVGFMPRKAKAVPRKAKADPVEPKLEASQE
ncbi:MAG: methyltransferase domain-containing protein [Planctomycetota bacterium]|nr:MAG: methyltransferase domain-containing protein [Planctomycetota bacterium]